MFNLLSKTSIPLLKRTLDAYSARHKAIAENMANVETRGYRPVEVKFEENLQKILKENSRPGKVTHPKHMMIGGNTETYREIVRHDKEGVNIEQEMAELAKNQIRFDFAARKLHGQYERIRSAILGRS